MDLSLLIKKKCQSLVGNIVTINNLSNHVNGQVVRLALLSSHYKQPLRLERKID